LKNDKVAYAIANYDLIEYIKNVQEPSDIALRVAAKLESSSHKILAKSEVNRRKDRLQQLLKNIGCDIIPSSANFIMARHNNNLSELLKSQSIDCMCLNNQVGLENKGYCRIAVGGSYDIQEIMKRLRR
jgi:histidinol-phosphate/aromatic aminotransferase/cobyric acid decarboxylase-like protein